MNTENTMKVFENSEFGNVRIIMENGTALFCASDVAKALGYANPRDAVAKHCRGVAKRDTPINGTIQPVSYIHEPDVYRLIMRSKLPSAERFERWVMEEVLPSIRKYGMYAKEELLADPDLLIEVATALKQEREARKALEAQVAIDAPKVLFADAVSTSDTCILIGELAKILKSNGINIGQNRLFDWLRNNGYLIKRNGTDYNMPTQKAMELGLFKLIESTVTKPDGNVIITKTTKVTGKGQQYFINAFLNLTEKTEEDK